MTVAVCVILCNRIGIGQRNGHGGGVGCSAILIGDGVGKAVGSAGIACIRRIGECTVCIKDQCTKINIVDQCCGQRIFKDCPIDIIRIIVAIEFGNHTCDNIGNRVAGNIQFDVVTAAVVIILRDRVCVGQVDCHSCCIRFIEAVRHIISKAVDSGVIARVRRIGKGAVGIQYDRTEGGIVHQRSGQAVFIIKVIVAIVSRNNACYNIGQRTAVNIQKDIVTLCIFVGLCDGDIVFHFDRYGCIVKRFIAVCIFGFVGERVGIIGNRRIACINNIGSI